MKKKFLYLSLFLALITLGGCKKYLDTLPDNRATITTPEQVSLLLTAAYPHSNYQLFCESRTDNMEDKGNSPVGVDPLTFEINSEAFKYQDELPTTGYDLPVTYFDSCYHAIAVANQALTYCNGADSAMYAGQKGEALLCRAYAHFMLTMLFAKTYDPATAATDPGVPYITAVQSHVFTTHDRKTVQYDYDMIEQDLNRGIALIQEKTYGTAPKFHFTLQAAHAFASRFYMFKQNYQQAIDHSNAVFGTSDPASVIRDEVTLFNTLQYADYSVRYNSSSDPGNILLAEVYSAYPQNYYTYRYGYGQKLNVQLFSQANVTGGAYGWITYGATPQYFNFPKFYAYGNYYGILPLFSAEEVLLNRAEAYVRLKNYTAAITDFNSWISKNIKSYSATTHNLTVAKINTFYGKSQDSSFLMTALDFKRISYMQEGVRWFDILRAKIPVQHVSTDGFSTILTADDKRRLLQFPQEAVNEGIPLNPR